MSPELVSWIAGIGILVSVILAGRGTIFAWFVGLAASAGWGWVAYDSGNNGLLAMNVGLFVMYYINIIADARVWWDRCRSQREAELKRQQFRDTRIAQLDQYRPTTPVTPPTPPLAPCTGCSCVIFKDNPVHEVLITSYEGPDGVFVKREQFYFCDLCHPPYDAVHIVGDDAHYFVKELAKAQPSCPEDEDLGPMEIWVECTEDGTPLCVLAAEAVRRDEERQRAQATAEAKVSIETAAKAPSPTRSKSKRAA